MILRDPSSNNMSRDPGAIPLEIDREYKVLLTNIIEKRRRRPRSGILDTKSRTLDIYQCFSGSPGPQLAHDDVVRSRYELESYDGQLISVHRFARVDDSSTKTSGAPAVLHIHGGGMFMGNVEENAASISITVQRSGVTFFSVEYRLAPDHPHPTPTEDCYAALTWLLDSADKFDIDPRRIAIQGESAGGGIAAVVALMARDRGLTPKIAKQILIYPMLDDRTISGSLELAESALLDFDDNKVGWTALLGDQAGVEHGPAYASAARASSVEGLPPVYMDVGGLDIFYPEVTQYAARLAAANNVLELHVYPSVPHAFDALNPTSSVSRQAAINRIRALQSL